MSSSLGVVWPNFMSQPNVTSPFKVESCCMIIYSVILVILIMFFLHRHLVMASADVFLAGLTSDSVTHTLVNYEKGLNFLVFVKQQKSEVFEQIDTK